MSPQSMAGLLLMEEEDLDDIPVKLPSGPFQAPSPLPATSFVCLGVYSLRPIIPPQGFADMGIRTVKFCRVNEIDSLLEGLPQQSCAFFDRQVVMQGSQAQGAKTKS